MMPASYLPYLSVHAIYIALKLHQAGYGYRDISGLFFTKTIRTPFFDCHHC